MAHGQTCSWIETRELTYDSNDETEPRQPSVQRPDPIAEIFLNDQRDDRMYYRDVNRRKMRLLELFLISESLYKPIVEVGPR